MMRRSRSAPEHFVQLLGLELVAFLGIVVLGVFKVLLNENGTYFGPGALKSRA